VSGLEHLKAREGDFVETLDDLIFDVKGMVHPPDKIVAYLRYFVDPLGDRERDGKNYSKVYSLSERDKIITSRYLQYFFYDPVFGEYMEEVPKKYIAKIHQPSVKVAELLNSPSLDQVEAQAIEFVKLINDSTNVPLTKIGLSGSILVNLYMESSDIDIIVYGRRNCLLAYEALRGLMRGKTGTISSYSLRDLEKLYEFRSKDTRIPLEDFIRIEQRKVSQGKFKGRDFFMRFLLDWNEVTENYGDRFYVPSGYARIKALVEDDSNSIFTPNSYVISQAKVLEGTNIPSIREIVSFRGRFCEQARKGEEILAQGKVEKVVDKDGTEYFRLIVGAKPSDFMINKSA